MQDIDFDEIDRAVSSVTNPGAVTSAPAESAAAPVVVGSVSTPIAAPKPAPTLAAPSFAARRSSGRFMDVVHPSSDMRPKTSSPTPSLPSPNREEPSRGEVAPRPAPAAPSSSAFHWPDPIEVAEPRPAAQMPPAPTAVQVPAPTPSVAIEEPTDSSLESPFLTDTKVEKRPLGAFSVSDSDLPLLEDFNASLAELVADEPESDEVNTTEDATIPDSKPEVATATVERDHELLLLEAHTEDENEAVKAVEVPKVYVAPAPEMIPEVPVGPTSITQQYKEQPSTASQPSGSIYDTEAYHQPLAHPTKKGSSLLVVVWILSLIVAGGGIGAAVYFFVLPMLQIG